MVDIKATLEVIHLVLQIADWLFKHIISTSKLFLTPDKKKNSSPPASKDELSHE